ncbi:MAG: hypothetical protein JSW10_08910 [Pseudomonadota bacterium]|nr:MAG: hypothetical protein JSW10_08910 [Pseudomonadota bacterium]
MTSPLADSRQCLERGEADYIVVGTAYADHVQIRFLGPFEGQTVLWDARLYTLDYCREHLAGADRPDSRCTRQFIEITPGAQGTISVNIGLQLKHFDEAAIRNTILMMRRYKRLRRGRHEFGTGQQPR